VFIASDPEWAAKFEEAGGPIVATRSRARWARPITHRMLARLFEDRGVAIDRTYQLNFGGNMDFKNMLERKHLKSKKISKTQSVTSQIDQGTSGDDIHIGPERRCAVARRPQVGLHPRRGSQLRRRGPTVEVKLEVWDSPNSAGVIIDALHCCKVVQDRGIGGPVARPVRVLHEEPAYPVPRGSARSDRRVRPVM
jgi:myo-inositol-1-phosphate synthase